MTAIPASVLILICAAVPDGNGASNLETTVRVKGVDGAMLSPVNLVDWLVPQQHVYQGGWVDEPEYVPSRQAIIPFCRAPFCM